MTFLAAMFRPMGCRMAYLLRNAVKLVPYFFLGILSAGNLQLSASLVPIGLVGVALGVFLVRRISIKAFYNLAYILMLLLGIKILWDGITGVFLGA